MAERNVRVFVALAAGKVATMAFGIVVPVLVGRLLGPTGLGQWTLLIAAGTIIHTALVTWTHASTVRYGREEWTTSHGLNHTIGTRLPYLAVSLSIAFLLIFFQPAHWLTRWFDMSPAQWWVVGLFTFNIWIAAEAQATLQATDRIMWQAIVQPLVVLVSTLLVLALVVSGQRSLWLTAVMFTVPQIVGWSAAWVFALTRSVTAWDRLVVGDVWRHLRYGLPVLPTFAVGYFSDYGDQLLLTRFSTMAQVGLFGIAYQFMVAAIGANGMLTTVMLPRLISREVTDPGYVRTYIETEVPTLYALWMIGMLWLVAALPVAVGLLTGRGFDESVTLLTILLILIPSSVVSSLYSVLFNIQERTGPILVYVVVMVVTNMAISVALIPRYGAVGSAIGTVVSYLLYQILYVWDQHRRLTVPATRVWTLWAVGVALGFGQYVVGVGVLGRLAWAAVATILLVAIVRAARCVDRTLIDRLFGGQLTPVAGVINRMLVART